MLLEKTAEPGADLGCSRGGGGGFQEKNLKFCDLFFNLTKLIS